MLQMTQPVLRPLQMPRGRIIRTLVYFRASCTSQVRNSHLAAAVGVAALGVGHMISHGHIRSSLAHGGDHRDILVANMARATISELKHHRSSSSPSPADYDQIRAAPCGQEGGGNALLRLLPCT